MRTVLTVLTALTMACLTGCASVATNRYLQAENPVRLQATEDGARIAFDLFSLEPVKEHPWATLGAALVDAGMMVGVYSLGEKNGLWGDNDPKQQAGPESPKPPTQAGTVNIYGDGNYVTIGGEE